MPNSLSPLPSVPRLGVLGSGKGSNFVAIQEAIEAGRLKASIEVVISDHADAGILTRAKQFGLNAQALPPSKFKTKLEPEIEEELVAILRRYEVQWVILAGYMRVVKTPLLQAFPDHIVNIHPSLLPNFRGLRAWEQALTAGAIETGCTVHLVNAEIDAGRVLGQRRVPVFQTDTPETLHARIQVEEHELFPAVLAELLDVNPS